MADLIKVVQGDTYPTVTLTLTNQQTGAALNLSSSSTVVRVYFREAGSETILSTITCTKVTPTAGVVSFDFSDNVLDVDPGMYEGEVEVDFGSGATLTDFEILKFKVRKQFS